jgi:hypothetical protein
MSKSPSKRPKTGGNTISKSIASPKRHMYDGSINMTEREVEIDHLKTVVLALNQKV